MTAQCPACFCLTVPTCCSVYVCVKFMQNGTQTSHWGLLSDPVVRFLTPGDWGCSVVALVCLFPEAKAKPLGVIKGPPSHQANILFLSALAQVLFAPWSLHTPEYCLLFLHVQYLLSFPLSDLCMWRASTLIEVSSVKGAFAIFPSSKPGLHAGLKEPHRSHPHSFPSPRPHQSIVTYYQSPQHKWVDSSNPEPHRLLSLHLRANCPAPQPSLEPVRTVGSQNKRHNGR